MEGENGATSSFIAYQPAEVHGDVREIVKFGEETHLLGSNLEITFSAGSLSVISRFDPSGVPLFIV